jgi:hypothetical protein
MTKHNKKGIQIIQSGIGHAGSCVILNCARLGLGSSKVVADHR